MLLALTAASWVGLAAVVGGRIVLDPTRARLEAGSPEALTGFAGTAVLGAQMALLGWHLVGETLLGVACCLWLALMPRVLRRWATPTIGISFMLAVSTESLAVLAALLAGRDRALWLGACSLVALALGLVAYAFVLSRFDPRQLLVGHGDQWVAGGALAIATLACAEAAEAVQEIESLHALRGGLDTAALGLWVAAALWLSAMLGGELISLRPRYDVRRWSMVFPLGMYAASSFAVADTTGIEALTHFARAWIWIAFVIWLAISVALLRRVLSLWQE